MAPWAMGGVTRQEPGGLVARMFSVVVLRVIGAALGFLVTIVLARYLGARNIGVYFLALTIVTVASVIARFGLDQVFLRFSAAHTITGHHGQLVALHRYGIRLTVALGALATGLLGFGSKWLATSAHEPLLADPLAILSLAIIPLSLVNLYSELLKGVRKTARALLIQSVGLPFVWLPMLPFVQKWGVSGVVSGYVVAIMLVLGAAWALWRNAIAGVGRDRSDWTLRRTVSLGFPFLLIALTNMAITWTDTLMLGWWAGAQPVGIYGMAVRFATLSSFVLVAVGAVIAPRFAELFARRDLAGLQRTARISAAAMALLSAPLFLILMIFPALILRIGGIEFASGVLALRLLTFSQFVIVVTGSAGYLLSMTGNHGALRTIHVVAALLNGFLNAVLIPRYGLNGAASATSISVILMNVAQVVVAKVRLDIWSLPSFHMLIAYASATFGRTAAPSNKWR